MKISIIIVAYDRKEFILDAIKSVLDQTMNRDLYEIIVIKNFHDSGIDKFIEEHCDRNIISDETTLGGKLAESLKVAKNNIVSFLEDDDTYLPDRLKEVIEVFQKNVNLVFYHNRCVMVDEKRNFIRKGGFNPQFNLSSMALNKNVLYLDPISKLNVGLDTFVYYNCMDSRGDVYSSDNLLTSYMYHESSSVFVGDFEKTIEYYSKNADEFIRSIDIFIEKVETKKVRIPLLILKTKFEMNKSIFSEIIKPGNRVKIQLWRVMRFLVSNKRNTMPLKSRFLKIVEYYLPSKTKRRIEKIRYEKGQRPT